MVKQSLVETGSIDEAKFVSFADDHTAITKGKMYEIFTGKPIGLELGTPSKMGFVKYDYAEEQYIIDDLGRRVHGIWNYFKSSYYK